MRQGDSLSPTLFGIFLNDLAQEINQLNIGIWAGDVQLYILMYADDIVIMAENENNLQIMLDYIKEWCRKWRMVVNEDKTKVMHFRNSRSQTTEYVFKYGEEKLEIVRQYKYLGVILDEFLKFEETANTLAGAGGRALGSIISKFRSFRNIGFDTFTKMFNTNVSTILEYCSGVWGFKEFDQCEKIHQRAIRYYLGVHQKAPLLAICGDMGWSSAHYRRQLNMLRFWNRLLTMDENRLTKKVFNWDHSLCRQNWSEEMLHLFHTFDLDHVFHDKEICDLEYVSQSLQVNLENDWKNKLKTKPKLRTYIKFKDWYKTEDYVRFNICRRQRSLMAQFRIGILPLHVETGRFRGVPLEERLCLLCSKNAIEDEQHFVLDCELYQELRSTLFEDICARNELFTNFDMETKFRYLVTCEWRKLSKFVDKAWSKRLEQLYIRQER